VRCGVLRPEIDIKVTDVVFSHSAISLESRRFTALRALSHL